MQSPQTQTARSPPTRSTSAPICRVGQDTPLLSELPVGFVARIHNTTVSHFHLQTGFSCQWERRTCGQNVCRAVAGAEVSPLLREAPAGPAPLPAGARGTPSSRPQVAGPRSTPRPSRGAAAPFQASAARPAALTHSPPLRQSRAPRPVSRTFYLFVFLNSFPGQLAFL